MKLRRLRDVDVLADGDVVLVRGGDLDPDILSEDAVRYHSIYGVYGISPFATPLSMNSPSRRHWSASIA
jgi:hypothetical protein